MPDFEKMFRDELEELATQAKVPYSTELTLKELRHELEEDFYKAWAEAEIEDSGVNAKRSFSAGIKMPKAHWGPGMPTRP